jgi:hypothetical protein
MFTLTNAKKLELLETLLKNTEYQLIEFITTKEFNKKALEENPQSRDKIMPLILTLNSDIKQTATYSEFIRKQIIELSAKDADGMSVILEDSGEVLSGEVIANKK